MTPELIVACIMLFINLLVVYWNMDYRARSNLLNDTLEVYGASLDDWDRVLKVREVQVNAHLKYADKISALNPNLSVQFEKIRKDVYAEK